MPAIRRIRKVANPRRKVARKTASGRRKMSAKQIKFFGTKRQKSALKVARKRKRTTTKRSPASRSRNPALVLTLGAINPKTKKRSTTKMARRKTSKRRVTRRRTVARANPPVRRRRRRRVVRRRVTARRRNPIRRRRRVTRRVTRRRNPSLFGMNVGGSEMAQVVLGGLIGVAATKFIPSAIPINLGGGNLVRTLLSGVAAFVAGWAGVKFVNKTFGDAVLFGGLMQTGSVALNAFFPVVGSRLALTGLGEFVDTAGFAVPQNPVLPAAAPVPVQARMGVNGLDRAYGRSF